MKYSTLYQIWVDGQILTAYTMMIMRVFYLYVGKYY